MIMNTIMNKLATIGIIAAGIFGLTPSVALAASLNTVPGTPPTVQVSNYTENPNSRTAWFPAVNADAGEVVSVGVLYHNSSNEMASDVRIRLTAPSGVASSHAFSGSASAANANTSSGSATVNLSTSQALSLVQGGIFWRLQGCVSCTQAFPFGQTGAEIFTSEGLRLGNVAPNDFGNITIRFQVSNTTTGTGGTGGTGTGQGVLLGVTTNPATNITTSSATPSGAVSLSGIASTQVYFEWGNDLFLGTFNTTLPQTVSSSQNFAQSISGLASNTNYYFRAVAVSGGSLMRGAILSFNTGSVSSGLNAPIVITRNISKTGVPSTVIPNGSLISNGGDPTTQVWFEWGLSTALGSRTQTRTISGGDFTDTLSGLAPSTIYFVRAVARNDFDTAFGQIVSFQTDPVVSFGAPVVVTPPSVAPVVSASGARVSLSKTVKNLSFPNGTETQIAAWAGNTMEHTITVRNSGQVTLSNLVVSDRVSDSVEFREAFDDGSFTGGEAQWNLTLSPGESRTLRYRFVGKRLGDNVVIERSALASNSQVSRRSNATLIILNKFPLTVTVSSGETVRAGEQTTYTVTFKNEGSAELADVVVRAVMPAEAAFASASRGGFSQSGNDLVFAIGRLGPNETETITITGTVSRDVAVGSVSTFAATVSYKDAFSSRQFDETAITTSQVVAGGPFGAAALGFGSFFLSSALGWLILILILIAIALVVRRAMRE